MKKQYIKRRKEHENIILEKRKKIFREKNKRKKVKQSKERN